MKLHKQTWHWKVCFEYVFFVSSEEIQKSSLHKHSAQLMYMLSLVFMINEVSQDFSVLAYYNCEMLEAKETFLLCKQTIA